MPTDTRKAPPGLTIRLWYRKQAGSHADCQNLWPLLNEAERSRALSIKNESRQGLYITAHGMLRKILSQAVEQAPDQIKIIKTGHGKPHLAEFPELVFNLSHTTDWIVIAVGHHCQLGTDIETCKPRAGLPSLVEKCFAEAEAVWWHALPVAEKTREFYRLWTLKEAFVKATGRGIALGLERCIIDPENPSTWLSVPECCGSASNWHAKSFNLGPDVCLALVADRAIAAVELTAF